MKRAELEKYLGKKVKVTMLDNDVLIGILRKTEEYRELLKSGYYLADDGENIVNRLTFRSSHVKKLSIKGKAR